MTAGAGAARTKVPLQLSARQPHTGGVTRLALVVLLLLALSAGPAGARDGDRGGGSDDEVRIAGACGPGTTTTLRVRSRDDGIEVRFRLRKERGSAAWRVTIVHENRVAARATARTTRNDDSFEVRRTLPDLPGNDTVVVQAWGPNGSGCRTTATMPDESS